MKKVLLGIFAALVLALVPFATQQVAAEKNTHNFRISSFDSQYALSRDENNRSVLKTTETITAVFPESDQNHGLERALPHQYNGHSVGLSIDSVTNESGVSLNYSTDKDSGFTVLRVGDSDTYVHGAQTYKISYTQHDVTRFYKDTGRDEWYWDTNGTEWKVPIDALTITATIDPSLVDITVDRPSCYQGVAGSTQSCYLDSSLPGVYKVSASHLNAGENISIALGFEKNTFAVYQPTVAERIFGEWAIAFAITTGIGVILLTWLNIVYNRRRNRTRELHTLVTEYIPPKNASVLVASQVIKYPQAVFSAQLIDFAVRHFIEIIETKPKSAFKNAEYDIKVISDPATLSAEEQEVLSDMFGSLPKVGDTLSLKSLLMNSQYIKRTADNDKNLEALVENEYALRAKDPLATRFFHRWATLFFIVGAVTLSPVLLVMGAIARWQGSYIKPLTDKGLELQRYVLGLDKYIKAAEQERLKMLQGPETAQKVGYSVDVSDTAQMVKLYERVLPYAILFGREKEWAKRLGDYYTTTQSSPDWYSGSAGFNTVMFTSALTNFSSAAGYSSGSSSTGGSSGGGSSGGGGGGGGGGGW